MTIDEMKQYKREKGYTYAQMAELSGVPLGTIQKIFSGETTSPRYETLQALESLFVGDFLVKEEATYEVKRQGEYTVDDYRALPEDQRVELIDGVYYEMLAPTFNHQSIAGEIHRQIANYIMDQGGACKPIISPVDVQLDQDEKTMVQPDVAILCDEDKKKRWGIYGAPDFVLEVISPSTKKKDCTKKLAKYVEAGVREYWIVDPYQEKVLVYFFESEVYPEIYRIGEAIPVGIYEGKLVIDFSHIAQWIKEEKELVDD